MTTIALPERGVTLLPPWPQAIEHAGKRLENRSHHVARDIGKWRGKVLISQSKNWDVNDCAEFACRLGIEAHCDDATLRERSGKAFLVAELMNVLPADKCFMDNWHDGYSWGLILGRVLEVKPLPCTGGQGCWKVEWCAYCGRVVADSSRVTLHCPTCGGTEWRCTGAGMPRPELEVMRECVI